MEASNRLPFGRSGAPVGPRHLERAMTSLELVLYGLVQGATEFLPVSSSAHLYAMERLFAWPDAGRALAVAGHAGTLLAVMAVYRREVVRLAKGALLLGQGRRDREESLEAARILVASVPIFVTGLAVAHYVPSAYLAQLPVIAAATAIGALVLLIADYGWIRLPRIRAGGLAAYWFIGAVQVLALIPGASRAGCVVTAARLAGFSRTASVEVAFLLGLPAIGGAAAVETWRLIGTGDPVLVAAAAMVMVVAFVAALGAIFLLVRWVRYRTFLPFVIYRFALAAVLGWLSFQV